MPPRSPDESTPIDPIWNRIHHALGSPDALTVIRLFDPEEVGAVGSEKFAEVLRVSFYCHGLIITQPIRIRKQLTTGE